MWQVCDSRKQQLIQVGYLSRKVNNTAQWKAARLALHLLAAVFQMFFRSTQH